MRALNTFSSAGHTSKQIFRWEDQEIYYFSMALKEFGKDYNYISKIIETKQVSSRNYRTYPILIFSHPSWKNSITKIAKNFFWMQHIKNIWMDKKTMTSRKFQPRQHLRRPIQLLKTCHVKSKWLMTRFQILSKITALYIICSINVHVPNNINITMIFRSRIFKWSR